MIIKRQGFRAAEISKLEQQEHTKNKEWKEKKENFYNRATSD